MVNKEKVWRATRWGTKQAGSMLAEAAATSCPGDAGTAKHDLDVPSVVCSSADVEVLIQSYLESNAHDAWCLPSPEDCADVFSPLPDQRGNSPTISQQQPIPGASPSTSRQHLTQGTKGQQSTGDRKRRWLNEQGQPRAPSPSFQELR